MLLVDAVARRYGVLPHQVLDLDAWQLGLAVLCLDQHHATRTQMCERIVGNKGMVFPAVLIGE